MQPFLIRSKSPPIVTYRVLAMSDGATFFLVANLHNKAMSWMHESKLVGEHEHVFI